MTLAGLQDRDTAIDTLLSVARRETLFLAIALAAIDDEAAAVASARLRWAIGSARELIVLGGDETMECHAWKLDRIANRAQRWLVSEPPRPLYAIGGLVDRIAARRDRRCPRIAADDATLVDLDLDDLELSRISLHRAILTEVSARRAVCDAADARSTRWLRCQLEASSLAMTVFSGSTLEHCDLSDANLEGASWHRATLSHCALPCATLVDARLDRAVFSDCRLRGANLEIARSPEVATLAGARFVRCDLRDTRWAGRELGGATFIDCKLFGAHGAVALTGVVIERPDLSRLGDGSQLATQSEVVARWTAARGHGGLRAPLIAR
jgi:uncharacterized protein YjbI with pentapeptide repeats